MAGNVDSVFSALLSFATDFLSFLVLTAVIAAFAIYFGRDRLIPLIAGLYTALVLYTAFPYKDMLPESPYVLIGIFVLFAFIGLIVFSGLSFFVAGGSMGIVKVLILSAAAAGFLIAVALHVLPLSEVYTLSAPTEALFVGDIVYFWWLVAPLGAVFFFGRG